ncbi:MAG: hypothetical protein LCH38_01395 [Proteobacteria bacterium]|nr:hypothetical protein [Pseudomonadota bacterium]
MRSTKAALLALALLGGAGHEAGAAPLRHVVVRADIHGAGWMADAARRQLPAQLRQELERQGVDRFPAGSRLSLQVTEIYLADEPGFREGPLGASLRMPDAIEGEVIVTDRAGRVLLRKPVSGRSTPSHGWAMPVQADAARRMLNLTAALAYWTARALR